MEGAPIAGRLFPIMCSQELPESWDPWTPIHPSSGAQFQITPWVFELLSKRVSSTHCKLSLPHPRSEPPSQILHSKELREAILHNLGTRAHPIQTQILKVISIALNRGKTQTRRSFNPPNLLTFYPTFQQRSSDMSSRLASLSSQQWADKIYWYHSSAETVTEHLVKYECLLCYLLVF